MHTKTICTGLAEERHAEIEHDEFHCPLCAALADVNGLQEQIDDEEEKLIAENDRLKDQVERLTQSLQAAVDWLETPYDGLKAANALLDELAQPPKV